MNKFNSANIDINGVITMTKLFAKLRKSEEGATAIEYGLIAALIAVVTIGGIGAVGTSLNTQFGNISTAVDDPAAAAAAANTP